LRWLVLFLAAVVLLLVWWQFAGGDRGRRERGDEPAREEPARRAEEPEAPTPSPPPTPPPAGGAARVPVEEPPMILRVLGPDGAPVEDARVSVQMRLFRGLYTGGGTAARRGDGAWVLRRLAQPSLRELAIDPPLHRIVRAHSPRFGSAEIAFETGTRDLRFEEPVRLVVRVAGLPEGPFRFCLRRGPRPWQYEGNLGVPARPRVEFPATQPGSHEVAVYLRAGHPPRPVATQAWLVHVERLELDSGDREAAVAIGPLHRLVVRFDNVRAGEPVTIERHPRRLDRSDMTAHVGDGGLAAFPHLPAGRYRVEHPGSGRVMFADAPAKGTVAFVPGTFDALRVTVFPTDNYWAKLGLETGTWIVGFDGDRFQPTEDWRSLLPQPERRRADAEIRIRVREPSGREREIVANYHLFFGEKGASAGHLEPVLLR